MRADLNLKIISILIDNSEQRDFLDLESWVTKEKFETITVSILNEMSYVSGNHKKKEFIVPLNLTLYNFKKLLASHFEVEIHEII